MLIFLNEDRAYQNWVTHHRLGFVLDGRRQPRGRGLTLHRAACPEVKFSPAKRRRWTTGNRFKACALDRSELENWARDESGQPAEHCPLCQPAEERTGEAIHLTRLGRDVLDYVLDATVIHLEHEYPPYRLTVGDIAACFAKTPGQLQPVLQRLEEQGLIALSEIKAGGGKLSPRQLVRPTSAALRTLTAFRDEPEPKLAEELARLSS
jgi:DNA-binding MarR family transcriptional regulator